MLSIRVKAEGRPFCGPATSGAPLTPRMRMEQCQSKEIEAASRSLSQS